MSDIRKIYDNEAEVYDQMYDHSAIHAAEDKAVGAIVASVVENCGSILDLGCGTGHVIKLAALNRSAYLGVDLSEKMLEVAKTNYPDYNFLCKDIVSMDLDGRRFDGIIAIYGQVNYIGLKAFANIIKKHGTNQTSFAAVVYADAGHDDFAYTIQHQTCWKPEEIVSEMKLYGVSVEVSGFSLKTPPSGMTEEELDQLISANGKPEPESKYYIVKNKAWPG